MKPPLKHVKWAEKLMPKTDLQLAFEAGCKARDARSKVHSGMTHSEALKKNAHRACCAYTPNNFAEMEYRGTLTDTYRK